MIRKVKPLNKGEKGADLVSGSYAEFCCAPPFLYQATLSVLIQAAESRRAAGEDGDGVGAATNEQNDAENGELACDVAGVASMPSRSVEAAWRRVLDQMSFVGLEMGWLLPSTKTPVWRLTSKVGIAVPSSEIVPGAMST